SEVFMIGVGNNGGAYVPERAQHLERFWVELHLRRHLKEKIDIRGRISAHTKPSQDARQNLSLNFSERPERRQLRRLGVEVDPHTPDVINAHGQPVIRHDTSRDQRQILVPQQRAIGVKDHGFDRHVRGAVWHQVLRARDSPVSRGAPRRCLIPSTSPVWSTRVRLPCTMRPAAAMGFGTRWTCAWKTVCPARAPLFWRTLYSFSCRATATRFRSDRISAVSASSRSWRFGTC